MGRRPCHQLSSASDQVHPRPQRFGDGLQPDQVCDAAHVTSTRIVGRIQAVSGQQVRRKTVPGGDEIGVKSGRLKPNPQPVGGRTPSDVPLSRATPWLRN